MRQIKLLVLASLALLCSSCAYTFQQFLYPPPQVITLAGTWLEYDNCRNGITEPVQYGTIDILCDDIQLRLHPDGICQAANLVYQGHDHFFYPNRWVTNIHNQGDGGQYSAVLYVGYASSDQPTGYRWQEIRVYTVINHHLR